MSNLHPIFEEILSTTIRQATARAEPIVTRIEFAPGHEHARLTNEQVAELMRKVRLAPRMLAVLRDLVAQLAEHDDRYREPECPLCAAVTDARAVIAEAEGRSTQEPAC